MKSTFLLILGLLEIVPEFVALLRTVAFMHIIFVEKLPAIVLVKGRVNGGSFGYRFWKVLYDSMGFLVGNTIGSTAARLLFDEAKDYMLLILSFLSTDYHFRKVYHTFSIDTSQLPSLSGVNEVAWKTLSSIGILGVDARFRYFALQALTHILCHLAKGQLRLISIHKVVKDATYEHL